jgi:hypothetical protein
MKKSLIGALVIVLVATISFAIGAQTVSKTTASKTTTVTKTSQVAARSNTVGIYVESIQRQIDIRELQKRYPGETAQRVDPAALKADSIVGWYDKGNNYHEQKMQNNLKSLGGVRILPEELRGVALRGVTRQ